MPILHVVFDTNVYRHLGHGDLERLRIAEQKQRIAPLASIYPIIELGAGLGDSSPKFNECLVALRRMWQHTTKDDGSSTATAFVADPDHILARRLFNKDLPEERAKAANFVTVLSRLANGEHPQSPELRPFVDAVSGYVSEREAKFINDMQDFVRFIDPSAPGWQPHSADPEKRKWYLEIMKGPDFLDAIARARVGSLAQMYAQSLTVDRLTDLARRVVTSFPTALYFFRNFLRGSIQSGTPFSRSKHANSCWDMMLAFLVSPTLTIRKVPLALVTAETKFHTAAANAGHAEFCLKPERYFELLKQNAIREYADSLPTRVV